MKKKTNLKWYLNKFYQNKRYLDLFIKVKSEDLLSLQRPEINHKINLKKVDRKDIEILWKPLYNMSQEKLLMLKKELIKLLNKSFI